MAEQTVPREEREIALLVRKPEGQGKPAQADQDSAAVAPVAPAANVAGPAPARPSMGPRGCSASCSSLRSLTLSQNCWMGSSW